MKKSNIFLFTFVLMSFTGIAEEKDENVDTNLTKNDSMENVSFATFGGGCFWCTEVIFEQLEGVLKVESGYSGGHIKNPAYREVVSGTTGHAEVIHVTFNSDKIKFTELLDIFFNTHDPTTLNRQGADRGTQYRSAVFYHSDKQKKAANNMIIALDAEGIFENKIVTEVTEFDAFYVAEDYHQDYFVNNRSQPYCQVVINPKLEKFQKEYKDKLKK